MAQTAIASDAPTKGQIAAVQDMDEPKLRTLSKGNIQLVVHAGDLYRERYDAMVDQLLSELVVQKAIDDGKFDYKYIDLPLEQWPLIEEPADSVKEFHPNEYLKTRDVLARVESAGKKFASPLTALKYAAKYPDKQFECPMAVIFKINGQLWCLVLGRGGDERRLSVYRCSLDGGWDESYRFLVVG